MRYALVAAMVLAAGCVAPSRNVQRSGIRGAGDLSVTLTLDRQAPDAADALVPKILAACDKIEAVLDPPDDLTLAGLVHGIKNEMALPVAVHFLADEIVRATKIDPAMKLAGSNDLKYILALVRGARRGVAGYDKADRGTP